MARKYGWSVETISHMTLLQQYEMLFDDDEVEKDVVTFADVRSYRQWAAKNKKHE